MKTDRREFLTGSLGALGGIAAWSGLSTATKGTAAGVQVATFVADITPPLGEALNFGFSPPVARIEHPLLAKGMVLRDSGGTYVLCTLDWCEIHNDSWELFRRKIGKATGTPPSHVTVHTLHQHTAPAYETEAQEILNRSRGMPAGKGLEFLEEAATRTAAAVEKVTRWRSVTTAAG